MVQGKITEADTPTILLGATPSRQITDSPPSSPIFTLNALPATTLPLYPGSGSAPKCWLAHPVAWLTVHYSYRTLFHEVVCNKASGMCLTLFVAGTAEQLSQPPEAGSSEMQTSSGFLPSGWS